MPDTPLNYATLPTLLHRYDTTPRPLAFQARNRQEWAVWRTALSAKLVELLGGFPPERANLDPVVLDAREEPGYRLEKVAFQTEPGLYVPCYVLIPRGVEPPYRPVIALPGHGTGGAAHVAGLIVNEATRAEEEAHIRAHNYDYGRQLALQGFLAIVPEQRGFGERLETTGTDLVQGEPMWRSSCHALSLDALLVGKTATGLRVWDVMRTIDYLRSRPEPLVERLGCLGLSTGGAITLFASALEPRISAAVISGFFNTFRSSIMSIYHCVCNFVPHLGEYAEVPDLAGLIAPRPLFIENGRSDPIFPVAAADAAYRDLQRVYEFLGVPERLDRDVFDGAHQFCGRRAFDWLKQWV
jgi:dienelactone hydrolase